MTRIRIDKLGTVEFPEGMKGKHISAEIRRIKAGHKTPSWKQFIRKLWDGTKVYLVDGDYVRSHHHIDFVEGGHDLVYDFVPKDEIWVEEMKNKSDESYSALHEIYEHTLMKHKIVTDYDSAHEASNQVEDICRSINAGVKPDTTNYRGGEEAE